MTDHPLHFKRRHARMIFFQATEIIIKLVILDPGCLTFAQPRIEANVDIGTARIEVKRINGKDGKVGCFWNTMEISGNQNVLFRLINLD